MLVMEKRFAGGKSESWVFEEFIKMGVAGVDTLQPEVIKRFTTLGFTSRGLAGYG
jgi:hypothetical protein